MQWMSGMGVLGLVFAEALGATSCITVEAKPGEPPCGAIQERSVFFVGVVAEVSNTGKGWPDGHPGFRPAFAVRYRVVEPLLGTADGEIVEVLQPDGPALGWQGFVEAYREPDGKVRAPICGRIAESRLLPFLRSRRTMKPTAGTSLTVWVTQGSGIEPVRTRVRIEGPVKRSGQTDGKGHMVFRNLPPGKYAVEADAKGGGTVEGRDVNLLAQGCGVSRVVVTVR